LDTSGLLTGVAADCVLAPGASGTVAASKTKKGTNADFWLRIIEERH